MDENRFQSRVIIVTVITVTEANSFHWSYIRCVCRRQSLFLGGVGLVEADYA